MTLAASFIFKLRSPEDARAGWLALAPHRLRSVPGLWRLPAFLEGVLALGVLLPGWVGRLAPIAACVLLVAFAVALDRASRRSQPGECGCFGSFSREPISRLTVVRTTSLAAVAALAARAGWAHPGWVPALSTSAGRDITTGLAGMALGLLALVLSVMAGRAHALASRGGVGAAAAAPGDPIPRVEVVSPDGEPVLVADLRQGAGLVLLVASTPCGPCQEVLAEVPAWQECLGAGAHLRIVTSSPRAVFEAEHPELADVTYFGALAAREALGVVGTPAAVLLGADGTVATPVAHGVEQIRGLLAGTADAVQRHSSPST